MSVFEDTIPRLTKNFAGIPRATPTPAFRSARSRVAPTIGEVEPARSYSTVGPPGAAGKPPRSGAEGDCEEESHPLAHSPRGGAIHGGAQQRRRRLRRKEPPA